MSKARTLANFVSAGNPLADGSIAVSDISGLTVTPEEVNILDGATLSTVELNFVDGVTSAIQTQLNAKAATDDIGVTIQPYDATLLNDADIGVTVQGYDVDTAKLDVAQTFTNNQTVSAEFIATSYNETFSAVTSSAGAVTVNCETGNVFSHTLTENTTFTFSNPPATGTAYGFTLKTVQDSTARTITWPASVDWAGGEAPTISAGSGEVDVFVFYTHDGGTTWYGFTAGQVMS